MFKVLLNNTSCICGNILVIVQQKGVQCVGKYTFLYLKIKVGLILTALQEVLINYFESYMYKLFMLSVVPEISSSTIIKHNVI